MTITPVADTANEQSEQTIDLRERVARPWLLYVVAALPALVAAVWIYQPWNADLSGVFFGSDPNDLAWMQLSFAGFGEAGPFGVNTHLAYPDGFSPWSWPAYGVGGASFAWFTVGVLGIGVAGSLWLFVALAGAANAAGSLFFFRGVIGNRLPWLSVVAAACVGLTPYIYTHLGHINLVWFGIVPLAFGFLLRLDRWTGRRYWTAVAALAILCLAAPMWWIAVAAFIIGVAGLPALVQRDRLRAWLGTLGPLTLALAVQALIGRIAVVATAPLDRQGWDSNAFGGRLSDIFVSSQFFSGRSDRLLSVKDGASAEWINTGLVLGVAAAVTVVAIIIVVAGTRRSRMVSWLAGLSLATLLVYLLGGLGNVQAGIAVFLNSGSPFRTWSRVFLILGILGLAWLLLVLSRRSGRWTMPVAVAVGAGMLGFTLLDLSAVIVGRPQPLAMFPQAGAINALRASTTPCPVAQLPMVGLTGELLRMTDPRSDAYFYLFAPDYQWSYGYRGPDTDDAIGRLPESVGPEQLAALKEAGYCAVVHDSLHARAGKRDDLALPGTEVSLPGRVYGDKRYSVYVL